ncbi:MAG TPA: BamA/TamA family outer membrane protein [Blastocatellia bacterium]|nr:BamA/TamA family outer membrane protein [Blastocatellia bacterium]
MIKSLLRVAITVAAGLILIGMLASGHPCQAQVSESSAPNQTVAALKAGALASFSLRQVVPSAGDAESADETDAVASPAQGGRAGSVAARVKSRSRNYPRRDNRIAINLGNKHLNAIFGGFEQGAGIGGGIELTTADSIHGIEFRVTLLGSTRLYRAVEGEVFFPRVVDERTHASFQYAYSRRTRDRFFGIGPRTPQSNKTNFDLEERSVTAALFRDFTEHFQAGVYFGYTDADAYRGQRDNEQFVDVLFSGNPAVVPITRWVPGLHSGSKVTSYGLFGEYDRRNNGRGLTRGFYFYGRVASADGRDKSAFSDYGWLEGELDARGYVPVFSDKTSLALRVATELKAPKGNSQIPFYDLARLGGRSYMRGFDTFRFYGQNSLLGSVELRQTVYARKEDQGADVILFGDAGQVWGDSRSRTNPGVIQNDRFISANWRASMGVGFAYRVSKAFAVRADYGHSNEANKIYFAVSRGF